RRRVRRFVAVSSGFRDGGGRRPAARQAGIVGANGARRGRYAVPGSGLLLLRRAPDGLVDFLDRALDLGVIEFVGGIGAEHARLDGRGENGFAQGLGRDGADAVAVFGG